MKERERSPDLAVGEEPSNIYNRSKFLRKQLWFVNPNLSLSNSNYSYKIKTQNISVNRLFPYPKHKKYFAHATAT